jgi:two-component system sensor histidine kinase ChiS
VSQLAAKKEEVRYEANTKRLFGLVMFINYILYFFIFDYNSPHQKISIVSRGIASLLCVPLIFRQFSNEINTYKELYWYLLVAYCLPFFFTLMTLLNHLSATWLMNSVSAAFLMVLIVNLKTFFILLILGSFFAVIFYTHGLGYPIVIEPGIVTLYDIVATYFAVVIIGSIFAYNKENFDTERSKVSNKIEGLNLELEQKVHERTAELNQALAAKTEFLNNMSHEIRTPIQGFTNVSEGLVEHWQDFDDKRKLELATMVASNAKRLASLVGNLLDLSKLNAGKMILDLRTFDLNEAILAMIEECQALYLHDKQLTIHFEQLTSAQIMADKERIMQVLRNLFINAIRFSPSSGSITVKLAKSEITYDDASRSESVHFVISDQGVGIPEEELTTIFCPFVQSSRTKTKAGGTGLGLAIAKEITLAHHGKIWAKNNAEGGASFEFILPHAQTKQMDGHFIVAENAELLSEEPAVSKAATILMVDDEEACLTGMEMLLHGTNYRLIKQSGGHSALDYLKAHPRSVDIIMLDLMMPDMYGLNVLVELKQDPNLSAIPVILQSGSSDTNEIEKAYQLGAVAYIKKPYLRQVILSEINKLLA